MGKYAVTKTWIPGELLVGGDIRNEFTGVNGIQQAVNHVVDIDAATTQLANATAISRRALNRQRSLFDLPVRYDTTTLVNPNANPNLLIAAVPVPFSTSGELVSLVGITVWTPIGSGFSAADTLDLDIRLEGIDGENQPEVTLLNELLDISPMNDPPQAYYLTTDSRPGLASNHFNPTGPTTADKNIRFVAFRLTWTTASVGLVYRAHGMAVLHMASRLV
jgi:hypothetical protein